MHKTKKRRTGTRFPNICQDAAELGVNRATLYRVLAGQRPDLVGLKRRYDALKKKQRSAGNN